MTSASIPQRERGGAQREREHIVPKALRGWVLPIVLVVL